jgi:hypothetical protein
MLEGVAQADNSRPLADNSKKRGTGRPALAGQMARPRWRGFRTGEWEGVHHQSLPPGQSCDTELREGQPAEP